jgi:nucleoside 2-deoxyribosyltransferase
MKTRKQIYLAAPLFNDREREFNKYLRNILVSHFNVFLPQEDGLLLEDLIAKGMEKDVAEKIIYDADISAMRESDIIIAVLDGANIDEGVAFELGFCRALQKICVGLQTDTHRQLPTGNNPMIGQSCVKIFKNIDAIVTWLLTNSCRSECLTSRLAEFSEARR